MKFVTVLEKGEAEKLKEPLRHASSPFHVAHALERLIDAIAGDKRLYQAREDRREQRAEWVLEHLDKHHTVGTCEKFDECACGAMFWHKDPS